MKQELEPAAGMIVSGGDPLAPRFLLIERPPHLPGGGYFVFPGGKIDPEDHTEAHNALEAARVAAIRELREETAIDLAQQQTEVQHWISWATPVGVPRRYAARFFYAHLEAMPDVATGPEVHSALWVEPGQALAMHARQALPLMHPTRITLQLLHQLQKIEHVQAFAAEAPTDFIEPVLDWSQGQIPGVTLPEWFAEIEERVQRILS